MYSSLQVFGNAFKKIVDLQELPELTALSELYKRTATEREIKLLSHRCYLQINKKIEYIYFRWRGPEAGGQWMDACNFFLRISN